MSNKRGLSDKEVEQEIERLKNSAAVKLAKTEQRMRNKRRQYLYCLRVLENQGKALMQAGITEEVLREMYTENDCEFYED